MKLKAVPTTSGCLKISETAIRDKYARVAPYGLLRVHIAIIESDSFVSADIAESLISLELNLPRTPIIKNLVHCHSVNSSLVHTF